MGRLKLFGAVLSAMQIDPTRPHRDRLPRSRDGARRRRHLRGHRRADQPAADGQGDPGGRLLQADRRATSTASACGRRATIDIGAVAKEFGGGGHKNAAGCTVTGAIDALQKLFVEKIERRRIRMDGLLVIDKPAGPTSHDVVARVRRVLRRAPHRPHRHARSGGERRAAARPRPRDAPRAFPERERQGATRRSSDSASATDTYDAEGRPVGARSHRAVPARDADRRRARCVPRHVPAAAAGVLGQEDRRAAQLRARRAPRGSPPRPRRPPCPARRRRLPCRHRSPSRCTTWQSSTSPVTASRSTSSARPVSTSGRWRTISARMLGIGAHLAALRRTRSAGLTLADAMALDAAERSRDAAAAAIVPIERMLQRSAVRGADRRGRLNASTHGQDVRSVGWCEEDRQADSVRLFDRAGQLVGNRRGRRGRRAFASLGCPDVTY